MMCELASWKPQIFPVGGDVNQGCGGRRAVDKADEGHLLQPGLMLPRSSSANLCMHFPLQGRFGWGASRTQLPVRCGPKPQEGSSRGTGPAPVPFAQRPLWDSSHRPLLKLLKTQARPNGTQGLRSPRKRGCTSTRTFGQ